MSYGGASNKIVQAHCVHPGLFFYRNLEGYFSCGQKKSHTLVRDYFVCAQDWIRTSTPFPALPPQGSASTNFATWAEERMLVPRTGLEPAHLTAPPPEDGASTNFAIWAFIVVFQEQWFSSSFLRTGCKYSENSALLQPPAVSVNPSGFNPFDKTKHNDGCNAAH